MGPERRRYVDFVLQIEALKAGRYCAQVVESPAGPARVEFRLKDTLEGQELPENFSLSRSDLGASVNGAALRQLGEKLFRAVFSGDAAIAFRVSLTAVREKGDGLRLRLRLNQASALAGLPWEYLWDPAQEQFLALLPGLSIVRHSEIALAPPPPEDRLPIRVLVLIANPLGSSHLDLQQEWESIDRALRPLCNQGLLVLERIERATLASLGEALQDKEIHIIHFLGHGSADPRDGEGYLLFEDADGYAERVGTQKLGMMLVQETSLRLVVLNACEGGRVVLAGSFRGVAQKLVQMGVPAVVAMQMHVTDRAAVTFAEEFYKTLANRSTLDEALARSRHSMMKAHGMEWGAPVLYLRSDDGIIRTPRLFERIYLWLRYHRRLASLNLAFLLLAAVALYSYRRYNRLNPQSALGPCLSLPGSSIVFLKVPKGFASGETRSGQRIGVEKTVCVSRSEITEKQWLEIMPHLPGPSAGHDFPVTRVSYESAQQLVAALSSRTRRKVRLPRDGEWEYLASAGRKGKYFFADAQDLWLYANCQHLDGRKANLASVGSLEPNPWGLVDVYGNVQEWVEGPLTIKNETVWLRRGGGYAIDSGACSTRGSKPSTSTSSYEADFGLRLVYEP